MNSLFEITHPFSAYTAEHLLILTLFVTAMIWLIRKFRVRSEEVQQKALLYFAILLSVAQLAKIPVNLMIGAFDVTKDIPLHMCNFLPFIMIWVYASKSRTVWATVFFWIVLGVSQANLTPSVEYSLFHYDAIRYWLVHLGLVLLALYPAIVWKWELELKDVGRTVLWLNAAAVIIYFLNLALGSNYLYVMGKPEGTNFFSLLPAWPYYLLLLEVIIVVWSLAILGVFRLVKGGMRVKEAVAE